MARLGDWGNLRFFKTKWPDLAARLAEEAVDALPPPETRFAALERTQPNATEVVILGQDPYPTPGHANGLAFSVAEQTPLPRSLANIFRELENDVGGRPPNGDLGFWADQGVLLLNTALTTPPHMAGGHKHFGWQELTLEILTRLEDQPRAFVLWGNPARKFRESLKNPNHFILESAHPSPLSARRGFFGSKPFSKVNDWLSSRGSEPIDWVGKKALSNGRFSRPPETGI